MEKNSEENRECENEVFNSRISQSRDPCLVWKIGFDTAENRPPKVYCVVRAHEPRFGIGFCPCCAAIICVVRTSQQCVVVSAYDGTICIHPSTSLISINLQLKTARSRMYQTKHVAKGVQFLLVRIFKIHRFHTNNLDKCADARFCKSRTMALAAAVVSW